MGPATATATPVQGELSLDLEIRVNRVGRRKCPSCGRTRVLVGLGAWAADQPVGYGEALCYDCAGIRVTSRGTQP